MLYEEDCNQKGCRMHLQDVERESCNWPGMSRTLTEDCELCEGGQDEGEEAPLVDSRYGVTVIRAIDWTMFEEQQSLDDILEHDILEAMVVGFVVYEDEFLIVLSQQIFLNKDETLRYSVMVPKSCILERIDYYMGGTDVRLA